MSTYFIFEIIASRELLAKTPDLGINPREQYLAFETSDL